MTDVAPAAHPEAAAPAGATAPADAAKQYTGVHSFMVNACKFVVDTKYAPLKPLGRGAYGVVCSAMDKVSNRKVAIKKIPKVTPTTPHTQTLRLRWLLEGEVRHLPCSPLTPLLSAAASLPSPLPL